MTEIVRVWDAPTRLFHWSLVACFIGLVISSQIGGAAMVWHFRFGYGVLTLLLFRLVWGFQGGYWSRFATFSYSPNALWRYLRGHGEPRRQVGHNPMGALSVFAMLAFLGLQVASGLISDDEIAATGPLTRFFSADWVAYATYYHKEIGKLVLLMLVTLHIAAIGFHYSTKNESLIRPMLYGDKVLTFSAKSASDTPADRLKAAVVLMVCGLLVASAVAWLG